MASFRDVRSSFSDVNYSVLFKGVSLIAEGLFCIASCKKCGGEVIDLPIDKSGLADQFSEFFEPEEVIND